MATFAEKFEQKYKQTKTSSTRSSFAEKFESKGAGSRILEEYKINLKRREEEKQRKLQEEQARLEAEKNKPSFLQKTGNFLKEAGKEIVGTTAAVGADIGNLFKGAVALRNPQSPNAQKIKSVNVFGNEYKTPSFRGYEAGQLANQGKYKQAAGEIGGAALDVISTLATPFKGLQVLKGGKVLQGAVKAGTAMAPVGAAYGATGAMSEDKGIKDIAKETAIGAGAGLIGGGILGAIAGKLGSKFTKVQKAIDEGTTTEKEIVDIFDEKGVKGVEEAFAQEPVKLKPGELAPIVKEIEETTGKKLKPSEALQVKADLEKGISKEAIINDIVEPPKRTTSPVEPSKVKKPTTTPKESPLIQTIQRNGQPIKSIKFGNNEFTGKTEQEIAQKIKDNLPNIRKVSIETPELTAAEKWSNEKLDPLIQEARKVYHSTGDNFDIANFDLNKTKGTSYGPGLNLFGEKGAGRQYGGKEMEMISNFKNTLKLDEKVPSSFASKINKTTGLNVEGKSGSDAVKEIGDWAFKKDKANYKTLWNKTLQDAGIDSTYYPKGNGKNDVYVALNPKKTLSQPLQEEVEKIAKEIPKAETHKIETGKSITAQKMNKRFADDKQMATEYDVIEINKKLDDATKRLQENPEKAISEAFSEGGSNVDRVATLTELFEKSIKDGDEFMQKQAFNKLKQLAPETAQTMNMFKALTEANPHFSYMSSVVDLKLKNLVLSSSNLRKATKGMKPTEALNKAKKMAKEKISKDILNTKSKITIKKAQDLLDSLICK